LILIWPGLFNPASDASLFSNKLVCAISFFSLSTD
jgi:hypothetical protein